MMSVLKSIVPSMIDVQSYGLNHIPCSGPAILVGDHPNILDGIILSVVCPRPVKILVAAELCTSPLVRRMIQNLGWLPVERHASGQNGDVLKGCLEALRLGEVVAIFPEGKTNYGRGLLPFKAGAALLARKSGAPVVPFSVKGTEQLYPDGSKVFHRGRVALRFGPAAVFETTQGQLDSTVVDSTLAVMKQRVLELQDSLSLAKVGRGLPLSGKGLGATAVLKLLSLALLTVRWR